MIGRSQSSRPDVLNPHLQNQAYSIFKQKRAQERGEQRYLHTLVRPNTRTQFPFYDPLNEDVAIGNCVITNIWQMTVFIIVVSIVK